MRPVNSYLDHVLCLDFEASALGPGSFPLEVALAEAKTGEVYATLIRPTEDWLRTGIWGSNSAAIHKELLRKGLPVKEVAAELTRRSHGKRVLSDARIATAFGLPCFIMQQERSRLSRLQII